VLCPKSEVGNSSNLWIAMSLLEFPSWCMLAQIGLFRSSSPGRDSRTCVERLVGVDALHFGRMKCCMTVAFPSALVRLLKWYYQGCISMVKYTSHLRFFSVTRNHVSPSLFRLVSSQLTTLHQAQPSTQPHTPDPPPFHPHSHHSYPQSLSIARCNSPY
jgi:hypothetical protein